MKRVNDFVKTTKDAWHMDSVTIRISKSLHRFITEKANYGESIGAVIARLAGYTGEKGKRKYANKKNARASDDQNG